MLLLILLSISNPSTACQTPECIQIAKHYRSNMNSSVKPCDNFYEFACGNFAKDREVPPEKNFLATYSDMADSLNERLRDIIEHPTSDAIQKAKVFYDSCLNEEAQRKLGKMPLSSLLGELQKTAFENNKNIFEWEEMAAKMADSASFAFFKKTVEISSNDSSKYVLQIEPVAEDPRLKKDMSEYRETMLYQLVYLGCLNDNHTRDRIDIIIYIEKRLSEMMKPKNSVNKYGILLTYKEFKKSYPNIKWDAFFSSEQQRNAMINVTNTEYFEKLDKFMISEPKIRVHEYLVWLVLKSFVRYLHPYYQFADNEQMRSRDQMKAKCLTEMRRFFALPLASEYIQKHITNQDRSAIVKMIQDIKSVMRTELETASWMDEMTRTAALKKLAAIPTRLDYFDLILNKNVIEASYQKLQISTEHYFNNARELRKLVIEQEMSKLGTKTDINWAKYILSINAGYYTSLNKIFLSLGALQAPKFSTKSPLFVNYGSLGNVIGHEITHGFDTRGYYFDEKGDPKDWWDPETRKKFNTKAQCFVDQYGKEIEPVSGRKYDGALVLNEAIADNGGLRIAYQAYLNQPEDPRKLPGFEKYTSDQMFFIAYANSFCEVLNQKKMDLLMRKSHPFTSTRINVPIGNFEKFSEVFECSAKSPMFKKEKDRCRLW